MSSKLIFSFYKHTWEPYLTPGGLIYFKYRLFQSSRCLFVLYLLWCKYFPKDSKWLSKSRFFNFTWYSKIPYL